jgi:hypothetical protein
MVSARMSRMQQSNPCFDTLNHVKGQVGPMQEYLSATNGKAGEKDMVGTNFRKCEQVE